MRPALRPNGIDGDAGRVLPETTAARPPDPKAAALGPAERQLLAAILARASNAEIARRLHLSERLVKRRLRKLYETLGLAGRIDAALYAAALPTAYFEPAAPGSDAPPGPPPAGAEA